MISHIRRWWRGEGVRWAATNEIFSLLLVLPDPYFSLVFRAMTKGSPYPQLDVISSRRPTQVIFLCEIISGKYGEFWVQALSGSLLVRMLH